MNKTIVYMGNFILPDKNAAAQRVLSNAKLLSSLGYTVALAGASTEEADGIKSEYMGFPCCLYPVSSFKRVGSLWSTAHFHKVLEQYPDMTAIILYNYRSVAMDRIRRECKRRGIVCIADATEWYKAHGGLVTRFITAFDSFYRMRIVQAKMDALILSSRFLYRFYEKYGKPMLILPTLMDKAELAAIADGKANSVKTLVFAGTAGPHKDRLDIVFEILQQIKKEKPDIGFVFRIIGMTESEYIKQFPNKAFPDSLRDSAIFYGRLARSETLKLIAEADYSIFLRPDNRVCNAGSPTKLGESLSCGTPVITNRVGDAELYLTDGSTGWFVDTGDILQAAKEMAAALEVSEAKISEMKRLCKETDVLDYHKYQNAMRAFVEELGI